MVHISFKTHGSGIQIELNTLNNVVAVIELTAQPLVVIRVIIVTTKMQSRMSSRVTALRAPPHVSSSNRHFFVVISAVCHSDKVRAACLVKRALHAILPVRKSANHYRVLLLNIVVLVFWLDLCCMTTNGLFHTNELLVKLV